MQVARYAADCKAEWDTFVRDSKNGTFLFERGYMDYHADRFDDYSLMVYEGQELIMLLPANRVGFTIYSHQGLTYGGCIVPPDLRTPAFLDAFDALVRRLHSDGFDWLVYKCVPHIYHTHPAEEDRYALFLKGALRYRCDVLSVLELSRRLPVEARRIRGAVRANRAGVAIEESVAWEEYWVLLQDMLRTRYGVAPAHSLAEILLLRDRFPDNIRLFVARDSLGLLGGVVLYISPQVVHVQYMAASTRGRDLGALDLLHLELMKTTFADWHFYDFGISNEDEGWWLNEGLITQKEGFGGRAVVHEFYRLDLRGAGPRRPA